MAGHVAVAETDIHGSPEAVWDALTDPKKIREYMFGAEVVTEWKQGAPIAWKGEYEGTKFEDHGEILEIEPRRRLRVTHFSPLSKLDDVPENYHTITYELEAEGDQTRVTLEQDNNASEDEAERSRANWEKMLAELKKVIERE